MKRGFVAVVAMLAVAVMGSFDSMDAAKAKAKPKKKVGYTEAQKKEIRRRGREWCMKDVIKGTAQFDRIQILSDGRVRCWYRG